MNWWFIIKQHLLAKKKKKCSWLLNPPREEAISPAPLWSLCFRWSVDNPTQVVYITRMSNSTKQVIVTFLPIRNYRHHFSHFAHPLSDQFNYIVNLEGQPNYCVIILNELMNSWIRTKTYCVFNAICLCHMSPMLLGTDFKTVLNYSSITMLSKTLSNLVTQL